MSREIIKYDIEGKELSVSEIAKKAKLQNATIYARIKHGLKGKELLTGAREAGRKSKTYDVGHGKMMTKNEIAKQTGLSYSQIQYRISHGVEGEELLSSDRYVTKFNKKK